MFEYAEGYVSYPPRSNLDHSSLPSYRSEGSISYLSIHTSLRFVSIQNFDFVSIAVDIYKLLRFPDRCEAASTIHHQYEKPPSSISNLLVSIQVWSKRFFFRWLPRLHRSFFSFPKPPRLHYYLLNLTSIQLRYRWHWSWPYSWTERRRDSCLIVLTGFNRSFT